MDAKCINDLVCGLTKEKIYNITNIFIKKEGILYGLIDDYGVYNEYSAKRFEFIGDKKIEFSVENNGVSVSVSL